MSKKVESATKVIHQPSQVGDGGCSAPQMELLDPLPGSQMTTDKVDLMLQTLKIVFDNTVLA
ncbi:hypothetical protein D3C71_2160830 [compost metagenome]